MAPRSSDLPCPKVIRLKLNSMSDSTKCIIEVEHLDGEVNSVHTASAASQTLALHWLQQCNRDHVTCNGIRIRQDWMPTRLLSICGSSSTNRIKIIETNKSSPREYIALSHCWGLNPIITLTTTNSNSFKEGIDIDLLPKNFRDAIEIARWVCVGYLWVDSLCILQDSLDDWKKEAVTMKDVYKNALLTVAATRAQNSSIGCFTDRDPSLIRGFKIPTEQNGRSSDPLYCFDKDIWADGVSEAPLNTRAWVVQERFLSRRTLHFGAQQIFWECHELDGCEAYPRGFPPAIRNANTLNHFKDIQLTRHVVSNTAGLRIVTYYPQWERIIDAYTLSNLTKSTDKIIALSGIAAEMESLYGDEYLAGLWRRYLPELLMWTVSWESTWRVINSHLTSRCQYYRAPSWSWLSIDGPISSGTAHDLPVFIEILDVNVNYDIDRITAGYVRIRGVLTEAQTEWEEFEGGGSIRLLQGQEEDLADAYLDDNSEKPPDKVLLLPIIPGWYSARYDDTIEVKGLILCPTGKNELEYRRLGWFSSRGKEDCYAIEQGPRTTSKWNEVYISDDEIAELGEIEPQTFDDGGRDNLYRHLPTTVFTLV